MKSSLPRVLLLKSVLDVWKGQDCEAGPRHLLEVVCDVDYGNRNDRKKIDRVICTWMETS